MHSKNATHNTTDHSLRYKQNTESYSYRNEKIFKHTVFIITSVLRFRKTADFVQPYGEMYFMCSQKCGIKTYLNEL